MNTPPRFLCDEMLGGLCRYLRAAQVRIDWLAHAFTRCLIDNTPLQAADTAAMQRIPADACRQPAESFSHCPTCDRVFWRGSHYRCMRARLMRWQEGEFMVAHDR